MRGEQQELELRREESSAVTEDLRNARRRKILSESAAVVLTGRDFEILRFILEMKFASSNEIYEKFFSITRENTDAKSDAWAKKRLLQLERAGFLKSTYTFSESTRYFVATFRAYYALKNFYSSAIIVKPMLAIDLRTFIHDKTLLRLRLEIEENENGCDWISDRLLRSGSEIDYGFAIKYVPDAVYSKPDAANVALELEIAQKSKQRYRDKVRSYVSLLRAGSTKHIRIKLVRFICLKKACFDALVAETRLYGSLFQIEFKPELLDSKEYQ